MNTPLQLIELGQTTLNELNQATVTTTYEDYSMLKMYQQSIDSLIKALNKVSDYDEKTDYSTLKCSGEELMKIVEEWLNEK